MVATNGIPWDDAEIRLLRESVERTGVGGWDEKSSGWYALSGIERSGKSLMGKWYKIAPPKEENSPEPPADAVETEPDGLAVDDGIAATEGSAAGTVTPDEEEQLAKSAKHEKEEPLPYYKTLDLEGDWEELWTSLKRFGWRRIPGTRQRKDYFFLPPGVLGARAPWRSRIDYFDSIRAVRNYLMNDCKPPEQRRKTSGGKCNGALSPTPSRHGASATLRPVSSQQAGGSRGTKRNAAAVAAMAISEQLEPVGLGGWNGDSQRRDSGGNHHRHSRVSGGSVKRSRYGNGSTAASRLANRTVAAAGSSRHRDSGGSPGQRRHPRVSVPWSEEEVTMLQELVAEEGPGDWADKAARMRRSFLHTRTPKGLESQYYKLMSGSGSSSGHGGYYKCELGVVLKIDSLSRTEVDPDKLPPPLPIASLGGGHAAIACLLSSRPDNPQGTDSLVDAPAVLRRTMKLSSSGSPLLHGHELPPFFSVATAAVAIPTALQQKHPLHLGSPCKLSMQAEGVQVQRGRTPGPKGAGGPTPSSWSAAETAKLRACIEAEGTGCWDRKAEVVFGGNRSAKSLEAQYYRAIRGRPPTAS